MVAAKRKLGRPALFKSAKELDALIEAYWVECDEKKAAYTISGLAVALGCNRLTIVNYGKKESFFSTIEKADEEMRPLGWEVAYLLKTGLGA